MNRRGALGMSSPQASVEPHLPESSFTTAYFIHDIHSVCYPEGIIGPDPVLNKNAIAGKFRYDREFLLQFMTICKERPPSMTPHILDMLSKYNALNVQKRFQNPQLTSSPLSSDTTVSRVPDVLLEAGYHVFKTKTGINRLQNQQTHFEPVTPLITANSRAKKTLQEAGDSLETVERKVKALLNKLTPKKFDSISDQIISWANKSENEKDGRTLIQVLKLVFESLSDEPPLSEIYARLCRKMMEQISPKVQDDGIKNNDGKPITGGQLFRKYLLNRCQEDFERSWVAKEAAAATKAIEDEAVKAANEGKGDQKEEYALYSEEYYIAQKAKRRGLGLIKFFGELFKLQMLTERIMHECVKKLLGNVDILEEEDIESLCKLLTTVGQSLDTGKATAHMDVYFSRIKELTKRPHITPRMQFMLQDILELRECKWISRQCMSRVDLLGVTSSTVQAGDLSNFGKIIKDQPSMTFGLGSIFAGKTRSLSQSLSNSKGGRR